MINLKRVNIWYLSSFLISIVVAIPIVTVFSSFFETTSNYSSILKNTFLYEYIFNSIVLLDDMLGVQIDKHGANRTGVALRDNVDLFTTSTLVMLDYRGLNVNGINFFDADVSNLSNLDLERVEVVLGPASALYGPGVGAGLGAGGDGGCC